LEGLFRLSGTLDQIKLLKKSFDKGQDVDLSLVEDLHSISGAPPRALGAF
jgi:hypothetical protein